MKDDNWQAVLRDPSVVKAEVREHLEAENAYVAAVLGGTESLQQTLFEEMKGRIKEDDTSVPSARRRRSSISAPMRWAPSTRATCAADGRRGATTR